MSLQPKKNCCHVNISVSISPCIASLCGALANQQNIYRALYANTCLLWLGSAADLWLHTCQAFNISFSANIKVALASESPIKSLMLTSFT